MGGATQEVWNLSWYDCINPFGLPAHANDFEIDTLLHRMQFAAKLCPMCWYKAQKRNEAIMIRGSPKTYKQAGLDTL